MTNYNNEVPMWLREATKQYRAKKKKKAKSSKCDGCGKRVAVLHKCMACDGRFCTGCVQAFEDCGYYCRDCDKVQGIGPSVRVIAPGITVKGR